MTYYIRPTVLCPDCADQIPAPEADGLVFCHWCDIWWDVEWDVDGAILRHVPPAATPAD